MKTNPKNRVYSAVDAMEYWVAYMEQAMEGEASAMKKWVLFLFAICLVFTSPVILHAVAADPDIAWSKYLGGSRDEYAYSIQQTRDGGYIVAGYSDSADGYVSGNHGGSDYWIVKLKSSGEITWSRCLGGSGTDRAYSVQQTVDGGYIVAGCSDSTDGDVVGNNGGNDFWIVKLDNGGRTAWSKCLGGSRDECANSIHQTSDGGYIVAGDSTSTDGDVIGNSTGSDYWNGGDYWIVKLNRGGEISWSECFGGSKRDAAHSIQQTRDGGYIVAGDSASTTGDGIENLGGADCWILKLDHSGKVNWSRKYGSESPDYAYSIQETSNGGYVVAGSRNDDENGNFWYFKLGSDGQMEWEAEKYSASYKSMEVANSIQQTSDGGYIVAGMTMNMDMVDQLTPNYYGDLTCLIIKIDQHGVMEWEQIINGTNTDKRAYSIQQTSDGGYIIAGCSTSNGENDFWVVKLK